MKKLIGFFAITLAACGGSSTPTAPTLTTSTQINAFLDGKTMVMTGSDIPQYPNGFNENVNYATYTQCYNKTTIQIESGVWNVTSILGTLVANADGGADGTCENNTPSGSPQMFSSTGVAISNVVGNATCFDLSVTYNGFAQEGRGAISADGKTVTLELYFSGQVTGDHCATGALGTDVTLNGATFNGAQAEQVYVIQ
jgi:hypothetical protein